jgi:hypothetical protein
MKNARRLNVPNRNKFKKYLAVIFHKLLKRFQKGFSYVISLYNIHPDLSIAELSRPIASVSTRNERWLWRVICNMILSFQWYSIHWSKQGHLYIQIDPFALYFLHIFYMKEKREKKEVSKSDELLLLSECICHYRIVTERIVAVRSCVK